MIRFSIILAVISLVWSTVAGQAVQSRPNFSQGRWAKMSVVKHGVYQINADLIRRMGFDPATIDPRMIKVFGMRGGMLPQENESGRLDGVTELAIEVRGESDGKFDGGDVVLFYGEGADQYSYETSRRSFTYEHNLYSDKNFYFFTVSNTPGKRIESIQSVEGTFPVITEFDDFAYHELDEHNDQSSGREWFGEKFATTTSLTLNLEISSIVPGSEIKVISEIMGQTYLPASMKVSLNGEQIGTHPISTIPGARYSVKGSERRDTFKVNEQLVGAAQRTQQELYYEFQKATGYSQAFLDYVMIHARRSLRLYGSQTIFQSGTSLSNAFSTFRIDNTGGQSTVWDITNKENPLNQSFVNSGSETIEFSASTSSLHNFVVFKEGLTPDFEGVITSPNLFDYASANLIVITNPVFRSEAERFAAHRRSYSGWTVHVVTTEEVYDHFSSGRQDVSALRDFIKHIYDQNPENLKAALMFGRGSYDYKDRKPRNTNLVPTYESRNSLHPLQTYASDDFFGFMESHEGRWGESPVQNHTLDVAVGRLPVRTIEEARIVVDKIIRYDTEMKAHNPWRKKIVFVADDGNNDDGFTSLHQYHADVLANSIEDSPLGFDTKKLFMGTYKKTIRPNGEVVPQMVSDIDRAFEDGAVIINYTGHGSEEVWADERVFTDNLIPDLKHDFFPFLVTATCEFGRHEDPFKISTAEKTIMHAEGGAVGLVTTTRPVNATTNFELNQAFYEALFVKETGKFQSIGKVFLETKNNSISGISNRNFALLGDPSMTLALPGNEIEITSAMTSDGSDTLKALSLVTITGVVKNEHGVISDYNGTAEIAVFDKEDTFVTSGRNDPAFQFTQWQNVLFRGRAVVENGNFSLSFRMPKNIDYVIDEGKISAYVSSENYEHATGVSTSFKIGGSETNAPSDNTPPSISLYVGDATFTEGGASPADTYLVANLSDENGINISGYGVGNSLMAVLDGGAETFILNDYYVATENSYKSGTVRYPLNNLSKGIHTLTLKAWDSYNNPAQSTITFEVRGEDVWIEEFGNYPNPVEGKSTIFFTHNRSGDDLEAQLFLYTPTGKLLDQMTISISETSYKVDLIELDAAEKNLPAGVYVARLVVRSLSNGSKNERLTKLIILN